MTRIPGRALFVLLAAGLPAGAAAAAPKPPNVVLLIVDDLRADRLGAYGNARAATPNFDALARESVVFERAYAQAGWTLPSVSSILTGLYPTVHGARRALASDWPRRLSRGRLRLQPGNSLPESRVTLAAALRRNGYRTEAVVSCPFGDPLFGFANGFDEYWSGGGAFSDVNAELSRRLERLRAREPFFLYVHVVDAHVGGGEGAEGDVSPDGRAAALARYDLQVSRVDAGLGGLLRALGADGLLDRTVLAVTADHGEEFGEHGLAGHGASPYETALRVPLLVRLPGGAGARRAAALAQTIDLFPTFLDLAGLPPVAGLQGASLRPALRGEAAPARTAYSEIYPYSPPFNEAVTAVAARTDEWTYVWRPDGTGELYDARRDPRETRDAAADHPETAKIFRAGVEAWRAGLERAAAALPPIPGSERFLPPSESERLRRAGYLK